MWKSISVIILKNGLKIQWVIITSTTLWSSKNIQFPIRFSTEVYAAFAQEIFKNSPSDQQMGIKITGENTAILRTNSKTYNSCIVAIGY